MGDISTAKKDVLEGGQDLILEIVTVVGLISNAKHAVPAFLARINQLTKTLLLFARPQLFTGRITLSTG